MDDHTDTPVSPDTSPRPYLMLLGPSLVIVVAGLLMTAVASQSLEQNARDHSKRMFEAQHSAIVNAVAASVDRAPGTPRFNAMLTDHVPDRMSVRIDTLKQHTKNTVLEVNTGKPRAQKNTLRSEIVLSGEQWLVTSIPDTAVFTQPAREASLIAWVSGSVVSLFAGLVCLLVSFRWHRQVRVSATIRAEQKAQNLQLSNMQTEKSILRKALNDSEQRSRDLVCLSGAIVCELDEEGKAGYLSAGVTDVLGFGPADLSGVEISSLISEEDRDKFDKALMSARQDRRLQRVDLSLMDANGQRVPATVRALALHDTLHGFSGFRLSMQPG